jgi:hypothetical protein
MVCQGKMYTMPFMEIGGLQILVRYFKKKQSIIFDIIISYPNFM